jgi:plasmid stability protein
VEFGRSQTQNVTVSPMNNPKRATVYFEPDVHRALRLKAAASDRSISDMVNDAVKAVLAEDADDLAAFANRKHGKSVSFDTFVQGLKRRGRI